VDIENPQERVLAKLAWLSAYVEHHWPGAAKQRRKCDEVVAVVCRMDGRSDAALLHQMEAKIDASVAKLGVEEVAGGIVRRGGE
jgi:hypothetical protein